MIIRSVAPLRLGLAGGGTDVSPYCDRFGGYVLNAAINMYARCTIEPRDDSRVLFRTADLGGYLEGDALPELELGGSDGVTLIKAVYNRVVRQFNDGKPLPVNVTTQSDAPPGSGLGSSSTMVVAILAAFRELMNLPLGEYDLARLAYEIERMDAGLAGGKQDQYAATFGGFNFMEFYADERVIVNPLRVRREIIGELNARLVLYYSGRSRESANIIHEQSRNVERAEAKALQAMHEVKQDAVIMKEYLLKAQFDAFAQKLGQSWETKKKMAHSITNSQLDRIYDAAIAAGATSGKISGAGGGGFMVLCCDPVRRLDVQRALTPMGGQIVDFQFTADGAWAWRI